MAFSRVTEDRAFYRLKNWPKKAKSPAALGGATPDICKEVKPLPEKEKVSHA